MSFNFAGATRAIKVLPVLAAAMAFNLLTPAVPAGAIGITNVGTIGTVRPVVIGPTIYYPADLVVSASSRTISGDSFSTSYRVTITVRNIGDGPSVATQVQIWDRGFLPRLSVPSLSAGSSTVLTYTTSRPYPATDCTLVLLVDPGNLVSEMSESNNNASALLNIASPYSC